MRPFDAATVGSSTHRTRDPHSVTNSAEGSIAVRGRGNRAALRFPRTWRTGSKHPCGVHVLAAKPSLWKHVEKCWTGISKQRGTAPGGPTHLSGHRLTERMRVHVGAISSGTCSIWNVIRQRFCSSISGRTSEDRRTSVESGALAAWANIEDRTRLYRAEVWSYPARSDTLIRMATGTFIDELLNCRERSPARARLVRSYCL